SLFIFCVDGHRLFLEFPRLDETHSIVYYTSSAVYLAVYDHFFLFPSTDISRADVLNKITKQPKEYVQTEWIENKQKRTPNKRSPLRRTSFHLNKQLIFRGATATSYLCCFCFTLFKFVCHNLS